MLILSSKLNDLALFNIATNLLYSKPPKIQESDTLMRMISAMENSWDIRLRIANMRLNSGQINQAKSFLSVVDEKRYFHQAINPGQVDLLINVLIRTGKSNEALLLLELEKNTDRFSDFDNIEIRLRVINLFLKQNKKYKIKNLITNNDAITYFGQAVTCGQINLLFNVLIRISMQDVALSMLESVKKTKELSDFDNINIILKFINALLIEGKKREAEELISSIKQFLSHVNLTSQQAADYINILSALGEIEFALKTIKEFYILHPDLRGGFSTIGWKLCLNNEFTRAYNLFQQDAQFERLLDTQQWQYALLTYYHKDIEKTKRILQLHCTKIGKKNFSKFITRLYEMHKIESSDILFSINILEEFLNDDNCHVDTVEHLSRQYYYVGETQKAFEIIKKWECRNKSEDLYLPRVGLAATAVHHNDSNAAEKLVNCIKPEQVSSNPRTLVAYIQVIVLLDKVDALKLAMKSLFTSFPLCFYHSPSWCLTLSLVAYKFCDKILFEKCLEIGRINSVVFSIRYPWIMSMIDKLEQTKWTLPPFRLPEVKNK